MKLRKIIFSVTIALVFLTLALPLRASAQTPERFTALKISIWPEYDKPSVLVMLDGVLADASNLPRPISILIPADAQLFVTTWENPDGSLAPEQPAQQTKQNDGYTRVTFTTAQPKFRIEYYHDAVRGTPDKTINFAYKSIGVIDAVTVEIQQPLKASNFAVTPAPQTTRTEPDGFKYFIQTFSNIAAEQTLTAQIKYTKTDPNPSVSAQPAPAPVTASESNNWFLLIGLVALGLAVLLGFILLQQRALAPRPAAPTGARNRRRGKHRAGAAAAIFCTQCGRALGAHENFCPKCGAKRRAQG